ncbi:hypothetical protein [Streptomyces mirabilis]
MLPAEKYALTDVQVCGILRFQGDVCVLYREDPDYEFGFPDEADRSFWH